MLINFSVQVTLQFLWVTLNCQASNHCQPLSNSNRQLRPQLAVLHTFPFLQTIPPLRRNILELLLQVKSRIYIFKFSSSIFSQELLLLHPEHTFWRGLVMIIFLCIDMVFPLTFPHNFTEPLFAYFDINVQYLACIMINLFFKSNVGSFSSPSIL